MIVFPISRQAIGLPSVTVWWTVTGRIVLISTYKRKAPHFCVVLCVRVTYFHGQSPGNYAPVHVLNFCVRDGREPERRQWRIKRGRSVCSGRRGTMALRRRGHSPGTANGNRWTPPPLPENLYSKVTKSLHISVEALCSRYLFSRPVARQLRSRTCA